MKKRTLLLGLLLLACTFAEGCCWCGQPGPIRRWWNGGCCNSCYAPCSWGCQGGGMDCGCGMAYDHYGPAPMGAPNPTMPNAQPLSRAQYPAGQYPIR